MDVHPPSLVPLARPPERGANLRRWAHDALVRSGRKVTRVYRVYQPHEAASDMPTEVIYRVGKQCYTAYLEPGGGGSVVDVFDGWGEKTKDD